ncbi:M81 family metallopeptidase [Brucella anthropi]|uniref:M81 family metallopeptidase n=1 Tax=Brucella anthropi TaxID=529 RepID=UPI000774F852|nr:M81 family metallopeptidase [Brucella anthropi]KXO73898.1 MlrC-like protein [Brucella anthropi]
MKIGIGGFQHETNTFAPGTTGWAEFNTPGGWPPLTLGGAILEVMRGRNLPIAGMIDEAISQNVEFQPLIWCQAEPGGTVERLAYERVVTLFLDAISSKGPFDGILLDLHGAMVVEGIGDGEGDFLRRIREAVGPEVLIACSLDLHANISPGMVAHSDFMSAYRTYPHVDMTETGRRTAQILFNMCRSGTRFSKAMVQTPYLIPIPSQCTLAEPTSSIYSRLEQIERQHDLHLSFAPGFPPSDTFDCGPAIIGYSMEAHPNLDRHMQSLADSILKAEMDYARDCVFNENEGVSLALELARSTTKPIILVDTQDNPGAGGTGDSTGLIRQLLEQGAEDAIVAFVFDPQAAEAAHREGTGARFEMEIGGRSGPDGVTPLKAEFEVLALGDGKFNGTGEFYDGSAIDIGFTALLRISGTSVSVIVASRRSQAGTQAIFFHLGIDPKRVAIIGLKSSVHFRADFQSIAERIIVIKSAGFNTADPSELPYQKIRPGIRLHPEL